MKSNPFQAHYHFLLFISILILQSSTTASAPPFDLYTSQVHTDTTTFTDTGIQLPPCYFSSVAWGDYDNDGDLDLLVCGYNDSITFSKIFRNDSGTFVDIHAPLVGVQSAHGDVWVDYDNDGDLDLMIMGVDGYMNNQTGFYDTHPYTKIYRNDNGTFTDINADLIPVVYGSVSWGDFDNDGDLDLLLTGSPTGGAVMKSGMSPNMNSGPFDLRSLTNITGSNTESFITRIYRNDNGTFTDINAGLPGVWGSSAAWGDYDNDGDLDIALTGWGGIEISKIFRNDDGLFVDINAPLQLVVAGHLAWGDFDNDGDLDLLYTGSKPGWTGGFSTIYRNDNGNFVDIEPGFTGVYASAVAWGDYDNDGDLDVLLSGAQTMGNDPAVTKIYRNDNGTFTDAGFDIQGVHNCSVAWGDFDNDGDLDFVISGGVTTGGPPPYNPVTKIYRNNNGSNQYSVNTKPTAPGTLNSTISGGTVTLSWDKGQDAQTPQGALLYNLRVGTGSHGVQLVAPAADPASGFPRVPKLSNAGHDRHWSINNLPKGTYYWSVQAVDNGYEGSSFASEREFTVGSLLTPVVEDVSGPSTSPTIRWFSVPGVSSYHLQVAYDRNFVSLAFDDSTIVDTSMTIGPLQPDTGYYWRLEALPADLFGGYTRVFRFYAIDGKSVYSYKIDDADSWHLISIPVSSTQKALDFLGLGNYPGCFAYNGSYSIGYPLQHGRGYWIRYSDPFVSLTGDPITQDTIDVVAGWNIVGSINSEMHIYSIPGGIISSHFFGYGSLGYFDANVAGRLYPMHGYWVKCSTPGKLILSSAGETFAGPDIRRPINLASAMNSLSFSNTSGFRERLYFGEPPEGETDAANYELPPPGPEPGLDVRFGSGYLLAIPQTGVKDFPIRVVSASYPVRMSWQVNASTAAASITIDGKRIYLAGEGYVDINNPAAMLALQFTGPEAQQPPPKFSLLQNYPNPFNPKTVISYSLSVNSHATLRVYDVLGREVALLMNGKKEAGRHTVEWDAKDVPSGVYYYQMNAGGFIETKKMILLR